MNRRFVVAGAFIAAVATAFLGWRMVRPPRAITVSDWFALPIATLGPAAPSFDPSAAACAACHAESHAEWASTMHAQVWDDAFFHADWHRQGDNPICLNCHTPLDRQQKHLILGFHGDDRWNPVLAPNPAFDPALQREGVTCAACHVRDGVVYGPWAGLDAPHPTARWTHPDEACVRCHTARNTDWDAFLSQPPCGTIREIERRGVRDAGRAATPPDDGYLTAGPNADYAALRCVECHMPAVDRPLVTDGAVRPARRHLWSGGHDPATVRKALTIGFAGTPAPSGATTYTLSIANTGAAHDVPTGSTDHRMSVTLQVVDGADRPLQSQTHMLEREALGRPFLIDLWDTRLRADEPRSYALTVPAAGEGVAIEAVVRYWLMKPSYRDRLDYRFPISEEIYRERIPFAPRG